MSWRSWLLSAQKSVSQAPPIVGFTDSNTEEFPINSNSTPVALPETQLTQSRQASPIVEFLASFTQEISMQSDISPIALPETHLTQNEQDQPSTNPIQSEILQTSPLVSTSSQPGFKVGPSRERKKGEFISNALSLSY